MGGISDTTTTTEMELSHDQHFPWHFLKTSMTTVMTMTTDGLDNESGHQTWLLSLDSAHSTHFCCAFYCHFFISLARTSFFTASEASVAFPLFGFIFLHGLEGHTESHWAGLELGQAGVRRDSAGCIMSGETPATYNMYRGGLSSYLVFRH